MRLIRPLAIAICCITSLQSCTRRPKADSIYYNAIIYSVDSAFTMAEAIVIKDGKIIETGNNTLVEKYDAPQKVDVKGKFIYPGFIDAHCHFYGYSTDLTKCDLFGTQSFNDVLDRLKTYSQQNKFSWLLGRGWDQNDWATKEFPNKTELDSLFPNIPVYLMRIDGHAILVNQKALDIAGITTSTRIAGGEVEVKNNKLTGILIDNAVDSVKKFIPEFTATIKENGLLTGQGNCFEVGLTTVADAGLPYEDINFMDSLQKAGKLSMKVYAMAQYNQKNKEYWFKRGIYQSPTMHVCSFKIYADGALGSRGACLLAPYADQPGHYGFLLHDINYFKEAAKDVYEHNFQLNTHCIGDSANRLLLQLYGNVLKDKNNRRWRIEHCQVVNENDVPMFGKYSIIPSVQPTHATSDMYWAQERLASERIKTAYAYKSLMLQNGFVANGSDFPVEGINPLFGFYAAVSRKDQKGFPPSGFQAENALTREEALRGMTIWAAYACFEDKEKGSLEKGKTADFVILNDDIMTMPDSLIYKASVQSTFINGKNVYEKK